MNSNFTRASMAVFGALSLGLALPAMAEHQRSDGYQYDYAKVVRVTPIVRYVTVETPVRECYQVERQVRHRRSGGGNVAGAAIAGGIIGGIIGNQFGSGSGRDAATAAGVIIGSSIGADSARAGTTVSRRARQPSRQCDISYETHEEERIDGYQVTYRFRGVEYRTRMRRDPGDRIKVRVLVEPVSRG